MNTRFVNKAVRIIFILAFSLGIVGIPPRNVKAESRSSADASIPNLPMPRMDIDFRANQVYASGWIVGSNVIVSFDVPGSDKEWDYEKTVTVPEGWEAWCQFTISIDPTEFRIAAGQVARISDGTTSRQAILPDLRVTSQDPTVDTISGIAPPGTIVDLQSTGAPGGGFWRHPVADASGHWFADFAHPGTGSDEQGTFEIMPGTGAFWVSQVINDYVGVKFFWDYGPALSVFPDKERVETYIWPAGANLTLTIDDPATPGSPDLVHTQMAQDAQGSGDGAIFENLGPLLPGSTIRITDGIVTKTLIVTDLALTGVDPKTDTVIGTAEPGSTVNVHICGDNGCGDRQVSTGSNRSWQADFSVQGKGNQEQAFDIRPGDECRIQQADEDGDATAINWSVPRPRIDVSANQDYIEAWQWPLGNTITLEIDNPDTPLNPDYTDTQTVVLNPENPDQTRLVFKLSGIYDIRPGYLFNLGDGITTKTLIVTSLAFTDVDLEEDAISGTAEPGSRVRVSACDQSGCAERFVNANNAGIWVADFAHPGNMGSNRSPFDIAPGTQVVSFQEDDDGDHTMFVSDIPNPILQVSANQDYIEGVQWTLGNTITLAIDNPDTQLNPDYTDTKIIELNPGNPDQTYTVFILSGIYDIQPGYLVSLSDGTITKTHIATSIAISNLDLEHDTVGGNAEPGSRVEVWGCDKSGCTFRFVNANGAGNWMADFAHPGSDEREQNTFDLAIGTWVNSVQDDDDGDTTMFVLDITDPGMAAEPTNIVSASTPALPATIPVPTPTLWKPIIVIVLIIVPLILIGLGIWYLVKRRKKGKE